MPVVGRQEGYEPPEKKSRSERRQERVDERRDLTLPPKGSTPPEALRHWYTRVFVRSPLINDFQMVAATAQFAEQERQTALLQEQVRLLTRQLELLEEQTRLLRAQDDRTRTLAATELRARDDGHL